MSSVRRERTASERNEPRAKLAERCRHNAVDAHHASELNSFPHAIQVLVIEGGSSGGYGEGVMQAPSKITDNEQIKVKAVKGELSQRAVLKSE